MFCLPESQLREGSIGIYIGGEGDSHKTFPLNFFFLFFWGAGGGKIGGILLINFEIVDDEICK